MTPRKAGSETAPPCVVSGHYLWEFRVDALASSSSGVFGGSSLSACIGLCCPASSLGTGASASRGEVARFPGSDSLSWGFASSGDKCHRDRSSSFSKAWKVGDIIGMRLDASTGSLAFFRNGKYLGVAFKDLSQYCGSDGGGLVPCVALAGRGAQLSLHRRGLKHGRGLALSDSDGDIPT